MLTSVSSSYISRFQRLPLWSPKQMVTVGCSEIGCSILDIALFLEVYMSITSEARTITKINKIVSAVPSRAFSTMFDKLFLVDENILLVASHPMEQLTIAKEKLFDLILLELIHS